MKGTTKESERRVHVIACAVLGVDLKETVKELGISVSTQFLPGGLHNRPFELRQRLQEAIDKNSAVSLVDTIVVGYGVCGLGTVGIYARHVPLAIPRVHDCISLFLGSDEAYRKQFSLYPGTYYISAGWVEGKSQPLGNSSDGDAGQPRSDIKSASKGPSQEEFEKFVEEYGKENAEAIRHFLTSWQRNYQRAAFIDTGTTAHSCDQMAKDMAREFGWKYERIQGSRNLLTGLLTAQETSDAILIVPPHHITFLDPAEGKLRAVPIPEKNKPVSSRSYTVSINQEDKPLHEAKAPMRVGLGIDAGGTYTDAVIYDYSRDTVIQKAKALTTKWDYSIGIDNALANLGGKHLRSKCRDSSGGRYLRSVNLVSVSTTLATNSIVEGLGQKVALLVMPPYGWTDLENFTHNPIAIIKGQMETDGREIAPIDPAQIRKIVHEMLVRHRVRAFAVAGYASHSNPAHEIDVKRIIQEETSLAVTCGHEVSEELNYRVRAETAALNAGIIPYLESLFDRIKLSLKRRGISAPVMVVKSDGSLTGLQAAREKPIETILSGPAASVAGVRHLTRCANAIVVDMGGTTTDTAVVEDGAVKICTKGAVVGGWETHVKALDMRTTGLGGDSLIALEDHKLIIGPRRVAPVSWLAATNPKGGESLEWIERNLHYNESSSKSMELVALNSYNEQWQLDEREAKIVDALREGPCSLHELAHRTDWIAWQLLPLRGLEERHIIQRCGLTPTDVLHAAGKMNLWDSNAAKRLCRIYGRIKRVDTDTFLEEVLNETVRRLAVELLMKQIDESMDLEGIEDSRAAGALINNAMQGGTDHLSVNIKIGRPVIGMGAPVHQFLPAAAKLLHTEAVISPDADVANAIGAITSSVHVHKQLKISVDETGSYFVKGLADAPVFKNLVKAEKYAVDRLKRIVADLARTAGTSQTKLEIISNDMVGTVSDGAGVFLERVIEARVIGRPDITRLAASV